MKLSIRTKFVLTLVFIAIFAAVPLSLYILQQQEKEKIEATIAIGKGNTRLLALAMLDVFLKTGGQIDSMRIDAVEAINVFRDQAELGLLFGQTVMINQKNFGTVMATLSVENENTENGDEEKQNSRDLKLSKDQVDQYLAFQENHRASCLSHLEKACYNFAYVAYYEKYPVVLSVMSFSEEHILAPIRKLRKLIYISATVAVIISVIIGVSASQFLTKPILALVDAVRRYSQGERSARVHIKVKDELKTLGDAFNEMAEEIARQIKEIEDHRDNLELKVQERTKELQEALQAVKKLKEQQDADYFLTTFLYKPLCVNRNNSSYVKTEFYVKQKKEFEWRGKKNEIGGDIAITANLLFQEGNKIYRYIFVTNADAMGKSLQGVGGAIVFGTALNTILASSTAGGRALTTPPQRWLARVYKELHQIFLSFNGSMMVSANFLLVNEHTGHAYYLNAEHPYAVLYRDEVADFLEEGSVLRKLGADMPMPEEPPIFEYDLYPGDIIFLGSDGRDDLDIGVNPETGERIINEDETLFLKNIKKAQGDLKELVEAIQQSGQITDDFSLIKIHIQNLNSEIQEVKILEAKSEDLNVELKKVKGLLQEKKFFLALEVIENLSKREEITQDKQFHFMAGLTYLGVKDFKKANFHLESALSFGVDPKKVLPRLAVSYEKLNEQEKARLTWQKLLQIEPNHEQALKKLKGSSQ